jgi:alkanesulfonate monooxygenase
MVSTHAASVTERLSFLLAHRPGFIAPTVAARKLATLDQLSGGRLAVHIISGGRDDDQAKDGDYVDHGGRYRRSAEYVDILRKVWTSPKPIDHEGEFYKFDGAYSEIKCQREPHIPIYGGGGSDAAVELLSPGLDVFMLWGEPLAGTADFMARVRKAAGIQSITFSLSTRPILADTEDKAWDWRRGQPKQPRRGECRLATAARGGGGGGRPRHLFVDRAGGGDGCARKFDSSCRHT